MDDCERACFRGFTTSVKTLVAAVLFSVPLVASVLTIVALNLDILVVEYTGNNNTNTSSNTTTAEFFSLSNDEVFGDTYLPALAVALQVVAGVACIIMYRSIWVQTKRFTTALVSFLLAFALFVLSIVVRVQAKNVEYCKDEGHNCYTTSYGRAPGAVLVLLATFLWIGLWLTFVGIWHNTVEQGATTETTNTNGQEELPTDIAIPDLETGEELPSKSCADSTEMMSTADTVKDEWK